MAAGLTKFWIRLIEAVAIGVFLTLAVIAWQLSRGPLPLDALAPYIESALVDGRHDLKLKIGRAALQWSGFNERPSLLVENVQAVDPTGVIAALPQMKLGISVPALLRGDLVPEQVSISNPILRVTRRPDGSFAFGFASPNDDAGASGAIVAALIDALTMPPSASNRAAYLHSVAITDSTFVLTDAATGKTWLVPDAALNLERAGADVELSGTLPVIEDRRPWTIAVKGRYGAASRALELSFNLDDFRPAGIADLAPQLAPLAAVDFDVSGAVRAKLILDQSAAQLQSLSFDLKGGDGTITLPAPVGRAYPIRNMTAKGSIIDALDRIVLDDLRLELAEGAPVISATGEGIALNGAPEIALDIAVEGLSLAALKDYWPAETKVNTRRWITANLNGGDLPTSRFTLALAGDSLETLKVTTFRGTSTLRGIDVTFMRGMPPVEDTAATMTLTDKEITIALTAGHVDDPQSGTGLRVRAGTVRLADLGSTRETAQVSLTILGDLGEVLRLVDNKPLGYATAMGIDATAATGRTAVDLDIRFPLIADLKLDQLAINVKARVDGARVPDVAFNQPLTDSRLILALDRDGMDVKGTIALAGVPAEIVWRENFGGGEFRSRYDIRAVLDNAARPLVALTSPIFAAPYLDGPVKTHVIYTRRRDGTGLIEADADLAGATLAIAQLGWAKPPEKAGAAEVTATVVADQVREISRFTVKTDDAQVTGAASFGTDAALSRLTFADAKVGDSDLRGEIVRDETDTYRAEIKGAAFNASSFWKDMGRDDARGTAAAPEPKRKIHLRASFDRMWLTKDGDFRDVRLVYRQGETGIEQIGFFSNVDGRESFTFNLGPENGRRTFQGASADGGGVIRAIGLFDDIVGGALNITGELATDGSVVGRAEIANLKLVDAPAMARLLSVAALTGIVDELRGKGLSFDMLRVPFTYRNSVVRVADAEMFGTSLGLTGKGDYDLARSLLDFEGTIVPAYALNSVLGSIPLIGPLLTGTEKGGGVLAATYTYRGDLATAEPSVNPLAALTPGITRRIFDLFKRSPPQSAASSPRRADVPPAEAE